MIETNNHLGIFANTTAKTKNQVGKICLMLKFQLLNINFNQKPPPPPSNKVVNNSNAICANVYTVSIPFLNFCNNLLLIFVVTSFPVVCRLSFQKVILKSCTKVVGRKIICIKQKMLAFLEYVNVPHKTFAFKLNYKN